MQQILGKIICKLVMRFTKVDILLSDFSFNTTYGRRETSNGRALKVRSQVLLISSTEIPSGEEELDVFRIKSSIKVQL